MIRAITPFLILFMVTTQLIGCGLVFDKQLEWGYQEPANYPVLKAVGYAPISAQLDDNQTGKMLKAMKASKLDAYRELTEQVYGQKIDATTSVEQLVLQNANLTSTIQGVIRGARVIKQYPVGDDLYATELELDMAKLNDLYISVAKPKRLKKVSFY